MKKIFTIFFIFIIGCVFSWAQTYTINVTPNSPERGMVVIEEVVSYENGKLPGVFSVSDTKKVRFSQGNLQYQASTDTWRFAEHQYDRVYMGCELILNVDSSYRVGGTVPDSDNREISSMYNGWIDLFGWGTGNNPTNSSIDYHDYSTFFADWGVNKISNGGNVANAWFTLSREEWYYLINTRANASSKRGVAVVNGISGLVLLPDNWTLPSGVYFTVIYNTYTTSQWALMEEAGAVFLPAVGLRYGTSVNRVGNSGNYWSCTNQGTYQALNLYFDLEGGVYISTIFSDRGVGLSVRLCSEVE